MPPQEPAAISGLNPSGNVTNVSVSTGGYLLTAGSATAAGLSTAAAITSVLATSSTNLLLAANTARKGVIAYSCSGSANQAVISFTTTVTSTSFSFVMTPGQYWEMPAPLNTLGMAVGISTTLTGGTATVLVTELS